MKIGDQQIRRLIKRCLEVLSAIDIEVGENELENAHQRAVRDLELRGGQMLASAMPIKIDDFLAYAEDVYALADYLGHHPPKRLLH